MVLQTLKSPAMERKFAHSLQKIRVFRTFRKMCLLEQLSSKHSVEALREVCRVPENVRRDIDVPRANRHSTVGSKDSGRFRINRGDSFTVVVIEESFGAS